MSSAPRLSAHEVAEAAARDELEDLSRWRAPELPQDDPGPCPGCASWSRCEARLEACEAFFLYTKLQQWATAPRQPSRDVYDRLFSRRFRIRGEQLDGMTVIERRAAAQELAAGGCRQPGDRGGGGHLSVHGQELSETRPAAPGGKDSNVRAGRAARRRCAAEVRGGGGRCRRL